MFDYRKLDAIMSLKSELSVSLKCKHIGSAFPRRMKSVVWWSFSATYQRAENINAAGFRKAESRKWRQTAARYQSCNKDKTSPTKSTRWTRRQQRAKTPGRKPRTRGHNTAENRRRNTMRKGGICSAGWASQFIKVRLESLHSYVVLPNNLSFCCQTSQKSATRFRRSRSILKMIIFPNGVFIKIV